jgi:methyl-accepting chemotaxis protein
MIDDFGALTASVNKLMGQFSSIISGIKSNTSAVAGSAETISSAVTEASSAIDEMSASFNNINDMSSEQEQLISHADENIKNLVSDAETVKKHVLEQASSIQQTSASISEMSANIASVAEVAHKAAGVSEALSATSVQGNEAVARSVASMNEIQKSSAQVQQMVHVIQQLAAQTNLLAMNAAIEAAHAGEYGRGFAVVADEVRSLATSSAKSTHEIQQNIKDMIAKIDAGAGAISSAGLSFQDIAGKVTENGELVRTISNAMEEQRTGAEETMKSTNEVVGAIEAIKELTEKESVNAESVHDFMQNVVKASRTTVSAVSDSIFAAANLQDSISKVGSSAADNKETVGRMEKIVDGFII